TMRSMTRKCLQLFNSLRSGSISLKVHGMSLKFGLTTRTSSTFEQQRSSIAIKLDGPCIWPTLISHCTINLNGAWASQMHCLGKLIMVQGQMIMTTLSFSSQSCLPFVLLKVWQSKER
ncbi:hypothetical protein C0995_003603, partial [Termitomyces sp. Mi166